LAPIAAEATSAGPPSIIVRRPRTEAEAEADFLDIGEGARSWTT
jgi:hypothetical protein